MNEENSNESDIAALKGKIIVKNKSPIVCYVRVSKARGAGSDWYFKQDPDDREVWSRYIGHTVSIDLGIEPDESKKIQRIRHKVGPEQVGNKFKIIHHGDEDIELVYDKPV